MYLVFGDMAYRFHGHGHGQWASRVSIASCTVPTLRHVSASDTHWMRGTRLVATWSIATPLAMADQLDSKTRSRVCREHILGFGGWASQPISCAFDCERVWIVWLSEELQRRPFDSFLGGFGWVLAQVWESDVVQKGEAAEWVFMAALLRPSVVGAVFCGECGYALPTVASNFRTLYMCCVWSAGIFCCILVTLPRK
jgi:hypothetical protein